MSAPAPNDRTTGDRAVKLDRLRAILDARGAAALQLTSAESIAWLLDGARVSVPYAGPAVLTAVVDRDGIALHALANELDRLRAEEVTGEAAWHAVPWHAPLPSIPGALPEATVAAELRAARAVLLPEERQRYRELGAEVARAVTGVLRRARPDWTERRLAAELVAAVVALGAEPVVILAAGERRTAVPHPLPTAAPLGARAMAVVGARRSGLVVNLTRWLGAPSPDEAALAEVEADAYAATRPGRELREVLADLAASYARHGLGAEAWLRHHQGGPTGYLGRDPKVGPDSAERVQAGQAFAWNPSVPGAKLEDTVVVDADRVEVLTADPDWPTARVRDLPRPATLPYQEE